MNPTHDTKVLQQGPAHSKDLLLDDRIYPDTEENGICGLN